MVTWLGWLVVGAMPARGGQKLFLDNNVPLLHMSCQ